MTNITQLSQLKAEYEALVQDESMLLLTSNNCAIVTLSRFLNRIPDRQFSINPVNIFLNPSQDKLSVTGTINIFWGVLGWGTKGIDLEKITLLFTEDGNGITFSAKLNGIVDIGSQNISVTGVILEDNTLQFVLSENEQREASLIHLANFTTHGRLNTYLPIGINIFDSVPLTHLKFLFGFSRFDKSRTEFSSDIGVSWSIVEEKIVLKKVGLTLFSSAHFSKGGNLVESFGGDIHATLVLGEEFDVRLALNGQQNWLVELLPKDGNVLPGFENLADFLGGNELKRTVQKGLHRAGIRSVSVDYVGIGVDIEKKKIKNAVVSAHLIFHDLTFYINTHLPNFEFHGSLSPQTPIHLKSLVSKFFTGAEAFPEIDITQLDIGLQPKINAYTLTTTLYTDWELSIGEVVIGFSKFSLEINKNIQGTTTFINGKFSFLGADFRVVAQNPIVDEGWFFFAKNILEEPIKLGKLIDNIGDEFGIDKTIPDAFNKLDVTAFEISFNTKTKDFIFLIETLLPIENKAVDTLLTIEVTHNNRRYTRKVSGTIKVDALEFELILNQEQAAESILLAAYKNQAGKDTRISSLVEVVTDNADILTATNNIAFSLKDALLVVDKRSETKILFGLDIGDGLNISNLPLVGKILPAHSTIRMTFQPLLTNKDFTAADLEKVSPLVPPGGYQLPKEAKERLGFNMQLLIGQKATPLDLKIDVDAVKDQTSTSDVPPTNVSSPSDSSVISPTNTSQVKWFKLQKNFGPLHFQRIGIQYQNKQLWFFLDASLSLGGLNFSLDGLYAESALNPLHPKFGLHGLGLDYKKLPLEIGGAFLRQQATDTNGNTYNTYDGQAIIRTDKFALSAMGSYAYYQGHPSLFIYAFLDIPLGGPSFFFILGLAAGFGYNRRILVPDIHNVKTFPLVAEAIAGVPGSTDNLGDEIQKLHKVIPPAVGEYFLAVGIHYTSFEIIDSFALVMVSFGKEFEVDVLGISTLVLPTPEAKNVEPLAVIQMALKAVFNPDRGYLKVDAILDPTSFILSKKCHLSGGFAFYTWFKDVEVEGAKARAGDFVLSLGGYHPRFSPPPYYPKVDRLGFNWQVSSELNIKGDAYFALVPHMAMAGGHLSATWHSGGLKAWFNAGADFTIAWKPYHYTADFHLDMGVSYTFQFFGTHHINVDLGADLNIWGPEFSGKAHIHLNIISFDVRFGSHTAAVPAPLPWTTDTPGKKGFRESFLPVDAESHKNNWIGISVTQGLVRTVNQNGKDWYIINPKELIIEVHTAVPVTHLDDKNYFIGEDDSDNPLLSIGSMQVIDQIESKLSVSIDNNKSSFNTQQPLRKQVPAALWGKTFLPPKTPADKGLLDDVCSGCKITSNRPHKEIEPLPYETKSLLSDVESSVFEIKAPDTIPSSVTWLNGTTKQQIQEKLETKAGDRNAFLKKLGLQQEVYPKQELLDELVLTR